MGTKKDTKHKMFFELKVGEVFTREKSDKIMEWVRIFEKETAEATARSMVGRKRNLWHTKMDMSWQDGYNSRVSEEQAKLEEIINQLNK